MKIPGLTFIFIPIVVWLIFAYGGYVFSEIQEYYTKTSIGEILFTLIITNSLVFVLELWVRMIFDTYGDIGEFFSLKPIILLWDILVYINEKLTVKI